VGFEIEVPGEGKARLPQMVLAPFALLLLQGFGGFLEPARGSSWSSSSSSLWEGMSIFILMTSSVAAMAINSPASSRLMVCITSMCLMNWSVIRAIGMS
jgi:hypothetical protein